MRFTTKIKDGSYMGTTHNPNTSIETDIRNCVQKLGQLEDIEEELSIDLIKLFDYKNDPFGSFEIEEEDNAIFFDGDTFYGHYSKQEFLELIKRLIKAYTKMWGIVKEELL